LGIIIDWLKLSWNGLRVSKDRIGKIQGKKNVPKVFERQKNCRSSKPRVRRNNRIFTKRFGTPNVLAMG